MNFLIALFNFANSLEAQNAFLPATNPIIIETVMPLNLARNELGGNRVAAQQFAACGLS